MLIKTEPKTEPKGTSDSNTSNARIVLTICWRLLRYEQNDTNVY